MNKIKIDDLRNVVKEAYEKVKGIQGGKNADYIPFLAKIDPNLFGIAACLPEKSSKPVIRTTYSASNRYQKSLQQY